MSKIVIEEEVYPIRMILGYGQLGEDIGMNIYYELADGKTGACKISNNCPEKLSLIEYTDSPSKIRIKKTTEKGILCITEKMECIEVLINRNWQFK